MKLCVGKMQTSVMLKEVERVVTTVLLNLIVASHRCPSLRHDCFLFQTHIGEKNSLNKFVETMKKIFHVQ
jgi:hypothetical protein